MKSALLARKPRYPRHWQELPNGEDIKLLIEAHLAEISRQMFGYHFVKIGNLSSRIALPNCPIKHVVCVTKEPDAASNVVALSRHLPFQESSVDAVLLAHELDFAQDPHQILREVNRIIMPNGYVVLCGFNPFSLAGLMRFFPVNPKQILHDARFFSSMRIKDWFQLLGFEVVEQHNLVFSELFFERKVNFENRWQHWCEKYMPFFSAMYVIVARKRVIPLSLIKPQWKPKPNFSAVSASMRVGKQDVPDVSS